MHLDKLIAEIDRGNVAEVRKLLHEGATLSEKDRAGRGPLHHAVLAGSSELVGLLVDAGIDVNIPDARGWTALHFAAQDYLVEIASQLIDAGAEIDARDSHGNTPLWRAIFASKGRPNMIRVLVHSSADLDAKNDNGVSPRILASRIANFDVNQFLQEAQFPTHLDPTPE